MAIALADSAGRESERVIWPFALAFFEAVRVVVAWCELRPIPALAGARP